jgi:oligopeptide/dipeptide ABC transporter ATP-binding protein
MTAAVAPEELIRIDDLTVRYASRRGVFSRASRPDVVAVDGVSLSVARGQTLGIVGGTGSGKSTVAHVVMGMVEPTSGSVTIAGRALSHDLAQRSSLQRLVQVVLQDPYSSLNPRMRVRDIIAEPLTVGRPGFGPSDRTATRVAELLELVGLPASKGNLYPHQFSGGQRQRIAIARALAPDPELIVLDEPTSALDVSVRAQILNLLKGLQERLGVTYLVISHDLVTVAFLATDVAVMHLGRIVEIGPTLVLYREPKHPYTRELLASVPGASGTFLDQSFTRVPLPASVTPGGCRYAFRCALRAQLGDPSRCVEQDPPLIEVDPSRWSACHFPESVPSIGSISPWKATSTPGKEAPDG